MMVTPSQSSVGMAELRAALAEAAEAARQGDRGAAQAAEIDAIVLALRGATSSVAAPR